MPTKESTMHFTPTQQRLMDILGDEMSHSKEQLKTCIDDELADSLWMHISNLRKKLRQHGRDILTEQLGSRAYYRIIRVLSSPYNGKY